MINKKLEMKRIILFVLLTYLITWIPEITLTVIHGDFMSWAGSTKFGFLSVLLMFPPAIANILTRIITKEGWKDSYLHLHLQGNFKYYIFGELFTVFCGMTAGIIMAYIFGNGFSLKNILEANSLVSILGLAGIMLAIAPALSFYTFGEEFGWRAYLYPKLEELTGTTGAVIIGGIIWGLWHAPLTIGGHNFGTDYWGYPWLGIFIMCVYCIFIGCVLLWITKKTKSVYPACIAHSVNNNLAGSMAVVFCPELVKLQESGELNQMYYMLLFVIPFVILGIIILFIMLKEQKKA
ncbi:MAG: CPBP family intramembrane metalloprotease [Oscillospiraceae bacterium]|nr:CPBP family intramembrane metalloprotease [Oscillospiraceae bacterium]